MRNNLTEEAMKKLFDQAAKDGNSTTVSCVIPENRVGKSKITIERQGQEPQVFENVDELVVYAAIGNEMHATVLARLPFLVMMQKELDSQIETHISHGLKNALCMLRGVNP